MTRAELVDAVRRIASAEETDEETSRLLTLVSRNVPHPAVSDLIFYPPNGVELTPEQVVEIALAYQPIELREPPPLRTRALLSVQRALVGEVHLGMRAIEVEISAQLITIRVFTDGDATEEIREHFDAGAVTQVVADFPHPERGDPIVGFEFVRCDRPEAVPVAGTLVFAFADTLFEKRSAG
jgi:hypothetical protein